MKRIIAVVLVLLLALAGLSACAPKEEAKTEEDKATSQSSEGEKKEEGKRLKIVTTIFPQFDFARNIVGDKADVTMLLKPGSESHTFEPSPQDIKMIGEADLFIYTGGENDTWIDGILASLDKAPQTVRLIDLVKTVNEEIVEGMEHEHDHDHDHDAEDKHDHDHDHDHDAEDKHDHDHDHDAEDKHDHDHEHEELDEHVWTSPLNAIQIVEKLTAIVSEKDAANKDVYMANAAAYIKKLEQLDADFRAVVKNAKRDVIVMGDRFPFRYLADAYDLDYYAAFTGCSTETEASAGTVAFLIDKVKDEKIPVVFTIEFSSAKIADSICDSTGAEKLMLHSCHNVSSEELKAGEDYLSLMNGNVKKLEKALN